MIVIRLCAGFVFLCMAGCLVAVLRSALKPWKLDGPSPFGQVDPENFKVKRLSFYSELMWETRKTRAKADGVAIDWVVLRNRLHHMEARNQRRVGEALSELSKRVGFRVIPGLSERVIFRELFPSGLTLLDRGHLGELGVSHVAARQELREMIAGFALPMLADRRPTQSAA